MQPTTYRVLARKYRPTVFSDLIGQNVLVRTLSNAIQNNRLAHAFLLTGIRGVGKTTTARLIARALNCIGADGNGGPTTEPCGVCSNCKMIAEDRHVDILEMDAASHTGVGDMRDLIDTVHYAPAAARYKIYIIDEVHMLSNNAFNALLKTLEEPPPHVKFIFATTELRKIPVTILSRCQRFDLRRVDMDTLTKHLAEVAGKESVEAESDALKLIATAAEGSVRDALSMLDQAIAHSYGESGATPVTADLVRGMLGLADKSRLFDLLDALLAGKAPEALDKFKELYNAGADPVLLLQDMLDLTHFITRLKLVPDMGLSISFSENERNRGKTLADTLSVMQLSRLWQMLLKGINETRYAPHPVIAAEMVLVRIIHAADLPAPADLIRSLQNDRTNLMQASASVANTAAPAPRATSTMSPASAGNLALASESLPEASIAASPKPMLHLASAQPDQQPLLTLGSFEEAVALFADNREPLLYNYFKHHAQLVSFTQGRIEVHIVGGVPQDFTRKTAELLSKWTGARWVVSLSNSPGEATLEAKEQAVRTQAIEESKSHPMVASVLEHFPGATVTDIQKEQ